MATVQEKLKLIKSKSPKVLAEKYQEVFDQLVAEEKDPQRLQHEVETYLIAGMFVLLIRAHLVSLPFCPVVDEGLGVVVAKGLLSNFAEKVSALDRSVTKNVCEFALSRLLSRTVSFEEQVGVACNHNHGGELYRFLVLRSLQGFCFPRATCRINVCVHRT